MIQNPIQNMVMAPSISWNSSATNKVTLSEMPIITYDASCTPTGVRFAIRVSENKMSMIWAISWFRRAMEAFYISMVKSHSAFQGRFAKRVSV